jgi:undecaprenyl diphosphate synthase
MDGNRRWATEQGRPTFDGHAAGYDNFFTIASAVRSVGIKHAIFYAFSTENWQRSQEEVGYLIGLFEKMIADYRDRLVAEQVQVRFVGRRSDFSSMLQTQMQKLETESEQYKDNGTVWIALSYGGRAEIVAAVNKAIALGQPIDETSFASLLWTEGMPDPDIIIRTSGEQRLSNFLPWQSVYSELFFTSTYWPAFTKEEFTRIVTQYADRKRRKGV